MRTKKYKEELKAQNAKQDTGKKRKHDSGDEDNIRSKKCC